MEIVSKQTLDIILNYLFDLANNKVSFSEFKEKLEKIVIDNIKIQNLSNNTDLNNIPFNNFQIFFGSGNNNYLNLPNETNCTFYLIDGKSFQIFLDSSNKKYYIRHLGWISTGRHYTEWKRILTEDDLVKQEILSIDDYNSKKENNQLDENTLYFCYDSEE